MNDVRNMLVDAATRVFADHVDAKLLDAAKIEGWSPALWEIVSDAQLPLVGIPDSLGRTRYGGIGEYMAKHLAPLTGAETRVTVLGHVQRGGSPAPLDLRVLRRRSDDRRRGRCPDSCIHHRRVRG